MNNTEEKILVIHPKDKTTAFLSPIYTSIENMTLVQGDVTKEELNQLIMEHDRIMMMGHGSPAGLFSVKQFKDCGDYIIDAGTVSLLKQKRNSVFIWCNADQFVNRHGLKGFYTGMFISEEYEAFFCGLKGIHKDHIDESNQAFSKITSQHIKDSIEAFHENVKQDYEDFALTNPVVKYNWERLYLN